MWRGGGGSTGLGNIPKKHVLVFPLAAFQAEASSSTLYWWNDIEIHPGKHEEAYIMDAKLIGNLGRYMNHSCRPNVFVQNVFVSI